MKIYFKILLFISFFIALSSCASIKKPIHKTYPFPEGKVEVRDSKIYVDDQIFAEIFIIQDGKGIAICYYTYDQETWIWPEDGWSVRYKGIEYFKIKEISKIEKEWNKKRNFKYESKNEYFYNFPFFLVNGDSIGMGKIWKLTTKNISISPDGSYIYFEQPAWWTTSYKYWIEYGFLEKL